jgi:hypothetical protein
MTTNITQQSPEWLENKKPRIGGSEIYCLAFYYCKKELEQIGVDLAKDQPFQTALEIFLRIKHGLKPEAIPLINSEYGSGMEPYITSRLNSENPNLQVEGTRDFIIADKIHPLACCSPDGYIDIEKGQILRDFDDKADITKNMGKGTLEIKTTPYDFNFEAEAGPKFQYIFQLQYNMMLLGHKWGMLSCLTPKEKYTSDYNNYIKGKMVGYYEILALFNYDGSHVMYNNWIDEYYNLYSYNYIIIPPIQQICKLALERFQKALDNDEWPEASIDNKIKGLREKKMLRQLDEERFGTLNASEELDGILNERQNAAIEELKVATEKNALDIKIIKAMSNHVELLGSEVKAKFSSNGIIRYSKLNTINNKNE